MADLSPEEENFNHTISRTCKTCGNSFSGRFCNRCGEKIIEPSDKSILNFFGSIINALTFVNNKFFKTLKLMVLKTGYVSSQYIQGIRVPYVRPASMFFLVNLIYFLFPYWDSYNTKFQTQMNALPYSNMVRTMVEKRIEKEQVLIDDFEVRYDQHTTSMAKLLLILFVFLLALPLMILNYSKGRYFIDHLTVSLEFNALQILFLAVLFPRIIKIVGLLFFSEEFIHSTVLSDDVFSVFAAVIIGIFLYLMERRVYKQRIVWALIKAIILIPCFVLILQFYRGILFFITFWTL